MSDTPRTDAHIRANVGNGTQYSDFASFARQLERELNAAKAESAAMREAIKEAHESLDGCREDTCELIAERDWWKTEPRCGYSARWAEMNVRYAKAAAALSKLQPYIK